MPESTFGALRPGMRIRDKNGRTWVVRDKRPSRGDGSLFVMLRAVNATAEVTLEKLAHDPVEVLEQAPTENESDRAARQVEAEGMMRTAQLVREVMPGAEVQSTTDPALAQVTEEVLPRLEKSIHLRSHLFLAHNELRMDAVEGHLQALHADLHLARTPPHRPHRHE